MSDIPKELCVLPWVHQATLTDGSVIPCCIAKNDYELNLNETSLKDAWNSDYMKRLRLQMLQGQKVPSCQHCYVEEANGYRSHRVTEWTAWQNKLGNDEIQRRIKATDSSGFLDAPPVSIDLRIGNTCNLQCVMCRPQDSSKWMALAQKIADTFEDPELKGEWFFKSQIDLTRFKWYQKPEALEGVKELLPYMREMIIGGGEPMLLEEQRWLIEECVRTGAAKNIHLRYHTNGTILPESMFELWKHFGRVELFLSIDSLAEKNHYMRYPAQWSAIESNIRRLEACEFPNIQVMILLSVHVMSLFHLTDFAQWIEDQNFKKVTHGYNGYFHPGVVHYPPYLSVQVYPEDLKKVVTEKIRAFESRSRKPSNKIEGVLGLMNAADMSHRLVTTREYIRRLDQARSTRFDQVFPELNEYLRIY